VSAQPKARTTIVVAPDKFKGSLTAADVAGIVARALRESAPWAQVVECPIADGGDGTVALALQAGFTEVEARVVGPLGMIPLTAQYAWSAPTAVIEIAGAAGVTLIDQPDDTTARSASTYGVGLLVSDALDRGARRIILGLGGSATTDGGAGMITALGARLLDDQGHPLPRGGAALADLAALDLTDVDPRLRAANLVLACDVDNPLLGPEGAAAVYCVRRGRAVGWPDRLWLRRVLGVLGPADVSGGRRTRRCR
jgi:glycerate kinase